MKRNASVIYTCNNCNSTLLNNEVNEVQDQGRNCNSSDLIIDSRGSSFNCSSCVVDNTNNASSPPSYELFQLDGINTTNSNQAGTGIEFSDNVILIQRDPSAADPLSKKFSSSGWLQSFYKCFGDKFPTTSTKKLTIVQANGAVSVELQRNMKSKQRWILATFIVVAIVTVLLCTLGFRRSNKTSSYSQHLGITINVEELTERTKCPACFGTRICPDIISGSIYLNDWNRFTISKLTNSKNIFYATWNHDGIEEQIVLKKLANDYELAELDKAICDRHLNRDECDVRQTVISLINSYSHKLPHDGPEDPFILHGEKIASHPGTDSDILLCPSHRKMEFLISAHARFARGQHYNTILANILTMILINPEPLYLQAFPAQDGWPFPRYGGGCGRIIAEEYVGRRLTTYYNEPFALRAYIAKQLLEIANKFNENPTNFILYLTDITPDNFAVEENSNLVKVIDLENLIMVDKEVVIKNRVPNYDKLLVAESTYCENNGNSENMCFSFSTDDLCDRPRTDHNYYAICAGLLAPTPLADQFPKGFLHSAPPVLTDSTSFSQVLEICKDPKTAANHSSLHVTNRVEAAQTLIEILGKYLKNHSFNK